jgi:hypothetical protein
MAKSKNKQVEDYRSLDDQALNSKVQDEEVRMKKNAIQPRCKSVGKSTFYTSASSYYRSHEDRTT